MLHNICSLDDDSSECSSNTQPISNTVPSMGLNIGNLIQFETVKMFEVRQGIANSIFLQVSKNVNTF